MPPFTLKMSQAEFDEKIAVARVFDEALPQIRLEETLRKQWIKASDGFLYYVSPVERMEATIQ